MCKPKGFFKRRKSFVKVNSFACAQNYVVLLDSTLPRSQYDYVLPQVSFTAVGYHKHITLIFNPTVRKRESLETADQGGERRKTARPMPGY